MLVRYLFFMVTLTVSSKSNAFLMDAFTALPKLQDLAKAQTDCKLDVRLDIGGYKDTYPRAPNTARLVLNGLKLDLLQTKAPTGTVELPGANGPHPQTSSGSREIRVDAEPFFIGMNGMEKVKLERGGWELLWRENAPAGALICGFDVPIAAARNEAKINAGRIFLSFPIFTKKLLEEQIEKKLKAEKMAKEYNDEKNAKLAEMQATNNFIKKAFLYRDAAQAYEKMEMTCARSYQWIPNEDDVTEIKDGILIANKGTVWTKPKQMFARHNLIGDAFIQAAAKRVNDMLGQSEEGKGKVNLAP